MSRRALVWCAALAVLAGAAWSASRHEGKAAAPPSTAPAEIPEVRPLEAILYANLRHVINRGVDLYQAGEINSCYRLFEGSLRTLRPLLGHRPGLAKDIDSALANVERDPVIWRRAFALRAVLDKIRKEIKPPPLRPGPVEKPPVEKPPVEKPPVEKPPIEKPPVKKPEPGLLKAPRPLEEEEKAPETPERFGLLKMPRLLES